jgi:hypothetical protein
VPWKKDRSNIDAPPEAPITGNKYVRPIPNAIPRHAPIIKRSQESPRSNVVELLYIVRGSVMY